MMHLYNWNNWKHCRFKAVPAFNTYSCKFCYGELDEKNLVSIAWNWRTDQELTLSLWNSVSKSVRTLKWSEPVLAEVMEIR